MIATVVVVVAIAVGTLWYVAHEGTNLRCVTRPASPSLTGRGANTSGNPSTTLPPSTDNDSGRSREPDSTPDADNDRIRAALICP